MLRDKMLKMPVPISMGGSANTTMQTFLDAMPMTKEKMIAA
jgi:hypothetical protein